MPTIKRVMIDDLYDRLVIPDRDRVASVLSEEGAFLHRFAKEKKVKQSLETGFAYGCSAAYIMTATGSQHIVIDPYQEVSFGNLGIMNIERLGLLHNLRLIEERSSVALPKLLSEGTKIDFAFIDAAHKFDDAFVEWYYCDQLLDLHGHIVFHDFCMEAVKRVASFICTNRADYIEVITPLDNICAFRKISEDLRNWDDYEPF